MGIRIFWEEALEKNITMAIDKKAIRIIHLISNPKTLCYFIICHITSAEYLCSFIKIANNPASSDSNNLPKIRVISIRQVEERNLFVKHTPILK